jgi:hypothetical protein
LLGLKKTAMYVSRRSLHALTRVISSIHAVANPEIHPNVARRKTESDVIDDEWLEVAMVDTTYLRWYQVDLCQ